MMRPRTLARYLAPTIIVALLMIGIGRILENPVLGGALVIFGVTAGVMLWDDWRERR